VFSSGFAPAERCVLSKYDDLPFVDRFRTMFVGVELAFALGSFSHGKLASET